MLSTRVVMVSAVARHGGTQGLTVYGFLDPASPWRTYTEGM